MVAKVKTITAPTGGWNARDSWAAMPPEDAVLLDNWFPSEGAVTLRKGYTAHQTGLGDWVDTLAVYNDGNNARLLAAANGHIRNVTSGTTSLASAFTSDTWHTAILDGAQGWVNGANAPQVYNGTTVSAMSLTGTGLTAASVVGINVFKNRSYFWMLASQSFWYSALNTMGGLITEFKLGRAGSITGHLATMANITRDGGDGIDDLTAFIFSSGDVLIYQGSDPGDASLWSLVGLYRIAAPVGRRCTLSFRGDVIVITRDGYVSLMEVITGRKPSLSGKIQQAVTSATTAGATLAGWQGVYFPAGNFLLFNAPTSATLIDQHVMNTSTGAWCRFRNINARCWAVFNDILYFGGSGAVYKAWTGTTDAGASITADACPAFSFFGSNRLKQVTAIQPTLRCNGPMNVGIKTEKDYALTLPPTAALSIGATATAWGSAWGSAWSIDAATFTPFKSVTRVGRALAGRIGITTQNHEVTWFSSTYFYEDGGYI